MACHWFITILSIIILSLSSQLVQVRETIPTKIISGSESESSDNCPLQEERKAALGEITYDVLDILQLTGYSMLSQCGDGLWYRVAFLNMSDPSQHCPSAWREYTSTMYNINVCGRTYNSAGSCVSTSFSSDGPSSYSRVCGRVIGYQFGTPDAFLHYANNISSIDFDGVNITHGPQRYHIWSYVAGISESDSNPGNCPCSEFPGTMPPPSSIGNHYYCESAVRVPLPGRFQEDDPLWDGQQCEGTCCSGSNSPPWFSVQLPAPTMDMIEVSICGDESTDNEDTPIELLEIYVQ